MIQSSFDKDFDKDWRAKVTQMQVPLFHRETKGGWVLRFDDVLAAAKEQEDTGDGSLCCP